MKRLRLVILTVAAFGLATPTALYAQVNPNLPRIALPTEIDVAGTASKTIKAGTCRGFVAAAQSGTAQLRATINGTNYDFPLGFGWEISSPNGDRFGNDVTLTALAGKFTISQIQ